jgi:periodic tryptophan protein 1
VPPTSQGPSLILSRDLDLGKIFSTQFAPDPEVAMRVAVAGSSGSIRVWDLSTSSSARKAFGISGKAKETMEEGKVVSVTENDEENEEDEPEDGENGAWEKMDDN